MLLYDVDMTIDGSFSLDLVLLRSADVKWKKKMQDAQGDAGVRLLSPVANEMKIRLAAHADRVSCVSETACGSV